MIILILGAIAFGEAVLIAWMNDKMATQRDRIDALEHLHSATSTGWLPERER